MTRDEILDELRALNPKAQDTLLHLWADTFIEYRQAQANIAKNGPLVFHPRTGAPIDNPYIPIRDRAKSWLVKHRLKPGDLWDRP